MRCASGATQRIGWGARTRASVRAQPTKKQGGAGQHRARGSRRLAGARRDRAALVTREQLSRSNRKTFARTFQKSQRHFLPFAVVCVRECVVAPWPKRSAILSAHFSPSARSQSRQEAALHVHPSESEQRASCRAMRTHAIETGCADDPCGWHCGGSQCWEPECGSRYKDDKENTKGLNTQK